MDTRTAQDEILVNAAKHGDREAFGKLYDQTARAVYGYLYLRIGHREIAEDLLSATWLKAWQSIARCPAPHFRPWIYTIARHTYIDHLRGRRWEVAWDAFAESGVDADIEQQLDRRDTLHRLQASLAKLPESQRHIVIMRVWDELSYDEIAQILKKSPVSCRMQMSRALHTLRLDLPTLLIIISLYAFKH